MQNIQQLISSQSLQHICQQLWSQITKDFEGKTPLIIGILKGCQPFMADLIKEIGLDLEISYIKVKSYEGTTSTWDISISLDTDISIENRDVILVEDIIDTGKTMKSLTEILLERNPLSLHVVALLDKPERREVEFNADYIWKVIDDVFVIGYGMDYNEQYRNLPYVGILE